jgi:hypothetical protein
MFFRKKPATPTITPQDEAAATARVIEAARKRSGLQKEDLPDGSEAYAYSGGNRIHYGINGPDGMSRSRDVTKK